MYVTNCVYDPELFSRLRAAAPTSAALRFTVKMAEAAETPQHRFFCYCCKRETTPKLPVSHAELCQFTLAVHLCKGRARIETFGAHSPLQRT